MENIPLEPEEEEKEEFLPAPDESSYSPQKKIPEKRLGSFLGKLFPEATARHLILYLLTFLSTYLIGGFWYSICLMSILTAHEMGHYLTSVRYGVHATPPFFIPFPLPPFGTIGAIIKMKSPMKNRQVLFDIGLTGPIYGLVLSVLFIAIGLKLSRIVNVEQLSNPGFLVLGDSILFNAIQYVVLGPMPEGKDIVLHPVAFAGWVGLFITALNLLPIGQLDGGHVVYAVFGKKRAEKIFKLAVAGMTVIILFLNPGWFLLVALILLFGFKHPPPLDDRTPLDKNRKIIGILTMVIFILSFTPVPFPVEIRRLQESLF
jgi:membrane-associated protease RseP (regulator of RpoE activity)